MTHYENEDPLRKQVQITFADKDYIHEIETHYETEYLTQILNSEFDTSVIYYGILQQ